MANNGTSQGSPAPGTPVSMPGGNAPPGGGEAPASQWSAQAPTNILDGTYEKAILKGEIMVTKLNADNYMAWAHGMEIVLDAKELFSLVDGTEPMPNAMTRPRDSKAWSLDDKQARMWIHTNCEEQQHAHIEHCKISKGAWDALR
ncbi:hypothetical protein MMC07_005717 [Pseudocyphellaria aurata]|nr:hypothetical protein [Pseudocyphellaria aurata]